jgi:hypothetical protein
MIQIGDTKLTKEQENIIVSALRCYEKQNLSSVPLASIKEISDIMFRENTRIRRKEIDGTKENMESLTYELLFGPY